MDRYLIFRGQYEPSPVCVYIEKVGAETIERSFDDLGSAITFARCIESEWDWVQVYDSVENSVELYAGRAFQNSLLQGSSDDDL